MLGDQIHAAHIQATHPAFLLQLHFRAPQRSSCLGRISLPCGGHCRARVSSDCTEISTVHYQPFHFREFRHGCCWNGREHARQVAVPTWQLQTTIERIEVYCVRGDSAAVGARSGCGGCVDKYLRFLLTTLMRNELCAGVCWHRRTQP